MRKLVGVIIVCLMLAANAWAVGTVTETYSSMANTGVKRCTLSWTSDASGDATFTTSRDITGWIILVETDPGATAPTDDYDVVLNNANGADVMGGALADRDTSNTERAMPLVNGNYSVVFNEGQLSLVISNAGNAKVGEVIIYWLE